MVKTPGGSIRRNPGIEAEVIIWASEFVSNVVAQTKAGSKFKGRDGSNVCVIIHGEFNTKIVVEEALVRCRAVGWAKARRPKHRGADGGSGGLRRRTQRVFWVQHRCSS